MNLKQIPCDNLGLGLGLRNTHFQHILDNKPKVDWFEAISENFMDSGGRPRYVLNQIAERYPIVLHGVSMSIGSTEALDFDYLSKLKKLGIEIGAKWISDHLCWTGINSINSHDLLPLPLTEQSLKHVASRINQVQDFLGRQLVLENPSTYLSFKQSTLSETEFLTELCNLSDCKLLLDVNNVYVSCFNSDSDPMHDLNEYPWERVIQMHLAGHTHCGTHIIDTHDRPVSDEVWSLFQVAWEKTGGVSTLLEWDGDIPSFDQCLSELNKAKQNMRSTLEHRTKPVQISDKEFVSSRSHQVLSTPINFMVPDVMTDVQVPMNIENELSID